MVAAVRKLLLRPGLRDDVERFQKATTTLNIRHIVPLVVFRQSTPPYPKIEATLTDVVHRCGLFGDAQGFVSGSTCTASPIRTLWVRVAMELAITSGEANTERSGLKCAPTARQSRSRAFQLLLLVEGLIKRLCCDMCWRTWKSVNIPKFIVLSLCSQ